MEVDAHICQAAFVALLNTVFVSIPPNESFNSACNGGIEGKQLIVLGSQIFGLDAWSVTRTVAHSGKVNWKFRIGIARL